LRGDWAGAGLDPDLPVDVPATKGEMFALDAINHTKPDMLCADDSVHQVLEHVGAKEIGARR
jgi:hypothetical protein